ncbi:hypothetical protein ENBRE01_3189 [Enteropsectra breve]|nr:hypothetical protein ENBRE01_3189 [Enteropsectra breve]
MAFPLRRNIYSTLRALATGSSTIFIDNEATITYALTNGWLDSGSVCNKCMAFASVSPYNKCINGFAYRYIDASCNSYQYIFDGLNFESPKIKFCSYLKAIYKWVENCPEKNVLRNTGISKNSYTLIKAVISKFLEKEHSAQ